MRKVWGGEEGIGRVLARRVQDLELRGTGFEGEMASAEQLAVRRDMVLLLRHIKSGSRGTYECEVVRGLVVAFRFALVRSCHRSWKAESLQSAHMIHDWPAPVCLVLSWSHQMRNPTLVAGSGINTDIEAPSYRSKG